MASEKTASSRTSALDAHVARIDRQDKIATGVLTVIVGLVILLVVSIIAYIVVRAPTTTRRWRASSTSSGTPSTCCS